MGEPDVTRSIPRCGSCARATAAPFGEETNEQSDDSYIFRNPAPEPDQRMHQVACRPIVGAHERFRTRGFQEAPNVIGIRGLEPLNERGFHRRAIDEQRLPIRELFASYGLTLQE